MVGQHIPYLIRKSNLSKLANVLEEEPPRQEMRYIPTVPGGTMQCHDTGNEADINQSQKKERKMQRGGTSLYLSNLLTHAAN